MADKNRAFSSADAESAFAEESDDISDVKPIDFPAIVIFALLFFTVALQFFSRYAFNSSIGWTEEIARYLLILLGFAGGVVCARKNSHISLEFFYRHLPVAAVKPTKLFCRATVAAFFFYCGWLAIELAKRTNSSMASVQLPKQIIHLLVSAGCFLTAAVAVVGLIHLARKDAAAPAESRFDDSASV